MTAGRVQVLADAGRRVGRLAGGRVREGPRMRAGLGRGWRGCAL